MGRAAVAAVLVLGLAPAADAQTTSGARPGIESPEQQRANAHYNSGWALLAAESWVEATREFQAAIDINREFKLAYYGLGRSHMTLKHFVEAIRAYEKCRDLFKAQAGRNFADKAEAERRIQDDSLLYDMAIQRLQSGQQTASNQRRIQELQVSKRNLQMKTRSADSISLTSDVPSFVSLALGSAYFRSARMADAEREYKAAIETDPKSGEAHSNLAVLYLETGRIDDAEKAIKAAEKTGFKVNPLLKDDITNAKKKSELEQTSSNRRRNADRIEAVLAL